MAEGDDGVCLDLATSVVRDAAVQGEMNPDAEVDGDMDKSPERSDSACCSSAFTLSLTVAFVAAFAEGTGLRLTAAAAVGAGKRGAVINGFIRARFVVNGVMEGVSDTFDSLLSISVVLSEPSVTSGSLISGTGVGRCMLGCRLMMIQLAVSLIVLMSSAVLSEPADRILLPVRAR